MARCCCLIPVRVKHLSFAFVSHLLLPATDRQQEAVSHCCVAELPYNQWKAPQDAKVKHCMQELSIYRSGFRKLGLDSDKLPWPLLQGLTDCWRIFSLCTSSCDLSFRGQMSYLLPTPSSVLSCFGIVFNLYFIRQGKCSSLAAHTFTHDSSFIYILSFACDVEGFIEDISRPRSLSSLCHVMTVHASKTDMVLISPECDCEDYDLTVTVLLDSVELVELSWLIVQGSIRFIYIFSPLVLAIHLFFSFFNFL